MVAMASPWRHPKTGVYWHRVDVPAALRPLLGKTCIKKTLGTKDPGEAKRRFASIYAETLAQFAREREYLKTLPEAPYQLTEAGAAALAKAWLQQRLDADASGRRHDLASGRISPEREHEDLGSDQDDWSPYGPEIGQLSDGMDDETLTPAQWRRRCRDRVGDDVAALIRERALPISRGDAAFALLAEHVFREKIVLLNAMNARAVGRRRDWVETVPEFARSGGAKRVLEPVRPVTALTDRHGSSVPKQYPSERLSDLYERWKLFKRPKPKTELEWRLSIERFVALVGEKPVVTITRADVVAFRDARLSKVKPATVQKDLTALKTVLDRAVETETIERNPAAGIDLPNLDHRQDEDEDDRRHPYTLSNLQTIFALPVFTKGERPDGGGGDAAFWLPLIALFSGLRLSEIAQLLLSDVHEDQVTPFFNIGLKGGGKSLKNRTSRRQMPIHPKLIELGILDYVARLRSAGQSRLFPQITPTKLESAGGNWAKWWARYVRGETASTRGRGIPKDDAQVFHSFRHNFKDACRAAELPKEVHDRLTGHSSGDVGSTYGLGVPVEVLARAIAKVSYPNLDLSSLKFLID